VTVLAGGQIVLRDRVLAPGWVEISGGRIAAVGAGAPMSGADIDLGGAWLVPGFVDVHMHGGGGHSVAGSTDDLTEAIRFHRAHGTTSTLASLVAAPFDELTAQLARIAELFRMTPGLLGAHLEGPFLAAPRCGAQNPRHLLPPDLAAFEQLHHASGGTLRMVTVAPELTGAGAFVRAVRDAGVIVAIGHTDAGYDRAAEVIGAGATVATHLFNGMRPLHHREPGVIGAALDAGVFCELVNDGHHLHPAIVRLVFRMLPERVVLITDAVAAAGMPDGELTLGGQPVRVIAGVARLASNGALAGSTLTMAEAFRRSVLDSDLDVVAVAAAASTNPARLLGADHRVGEIRAGLVADLVVLDDRFEVRSVYAAGQAGLVT
jgi:N-acetylglucosamine-6-phosphate deacetylase